MTRWSVVTELDQQRGAHWEASWEYLVDAYRAVMERYVRSVLSRARSPLDGADEAGEIVQDFLVQCVEKGWLAKAHPDRGRFRAYLQMLLRRFTYGHLRHRSAQRRSPGPGRQTFEIREADRVEELTPADQAERAEFDRAWVKVAVDRALERLGRRNGRDRVVVDDLLRTEGSGSTDLAGLLGVRKEQVPVLRHRARKRFSKLFAEEVVATVGDKELFEQEWRSLSHYMP